MGTRRKAREYALQGLYMFETVKKPVKEILTFDWIEKELNEETKVFSSNLIEGTLDNIDDLDIKIKKYSKNWDFNRISAIEKSILRLSVFSMLYQPEIPLPVTINEGIELGKIYSGEKSGNFINGLLDAIRKNEIESSK